MISAHDELEHLVETLDEAEAEKVLAAIREHVPEIYGEPKTRTIVRGDGQVVRVTIPD